MHESDFSGCRVIGHAYQRSRPNAPFALLWFKPRFPAVLLLFLSPESCGCLAEGRVLIAVSTVPVEPQRTAAHNYTDRSLNRICVKGA